VRRTVLNRILVDRMSVDAARAALRRDFRLGLSDGFSSTTAFASTPSHWTWPTTACGPCRASAKLRVDELHLGRYTLLQATDPLRDRPVAFALVG
jgi:hypothetical protein